MVAMKKIGFLAALCLACGMMACSSDDEPAQDNAQEVAGSTTQEPVLTDSVFKLNAAQQARILPLNEFSMKLFREQSASQGSTVISPLSVAFVLGMINDGAEGTTREEILAALGFGNDDAETVNGLMKKLIEGAPAVDKKVTVALANNVTVRNDYQLQDTYAKTMKEYYEASVYSLDFTKPEALQTINGWCNEKTNGLIPKIIDELGDDLMLCLLNAIYFKGEWGDKFDKSQTYGEVFTSASGAESVKMIEMMHKTAKAEYAKENGMKALRLPFGDGRYAMTFLLPDKADGLADLKAKLTGTTLQGLTMKEQEVEMILPVFATEVEMNLIPLLQKQGLNRMFTPEAELPNIALRANGDKAQLMVMLMKQKTRLGVNEEGSEGAAVTIAEVYASEAPDDGQKLKFYANHPFVYAITEQATGAVFFIGQFCGN